MSDDQEEVQYGEYKGSKTIIIPLSKGKDGKVYTFSFGKSKAKAIVRYIVEIIAFAKEE